MPGQSEAQPVLRHGNPPIFEHFGKPTEQVSQIERLIRNYKASGYSTIAIIGRSPAELKRIQKSLPIDLDAHILNPDSATYTGGVTIAPATGIKGLEFDCVIISDASKTQWPNQPLDGRLLYVSLTRPLHELAILYSGELTGLLREAVRE